MKKEHYINTKEDIFEVALRMLDAGVPEQEIIDLHPTHVTELREFFESIKSFESAQAVQPSPELLRSTLATISTPIPSTMGRSSFLRSKISVSLAILALVLLGSGSVLGGGILIIPHGAVSNAHVALANDESDSSLNLDAQMIDTQIGDLDSDETQADQAVQQATSETQ